MPCRFASSGTVATSRSASRAILALNVASNFLRDLVISVLHRLRQSRTLHTLTFGPISGVHFKGMKLEPAILSVIGWHAKESVEEIVERKRDDIKKIGQTFWFFQSWKAPIPSVQRFGYSFPNPTVIFLKGGAYPTSANSEAREMSRDKKSWGPLPTGIGKVTGKIPGGGLVIGDLLPAQEEIDLWYFLDHSDLQPLRFKAA